MGLRRQVIKGTILLGAAQFGGQICQFLRNVIVARHVAPADFGIAATLSMSVYLFSMASNFEPSIQLIQAEDGDIPKFQRTAQAVESGRGVMNALLLLALAWPLAHLFKVPGALWAFLLLPLYPLLNGFSHLDRMRVQRDLRYGPYVISELSMQILLLALAWPLAAWLRDYSAMLWLLLCQAAAAAILSHVVAVRSYRWSWDRKYLRKIFSFGWPLVINGLLLFAIMQGDRAVVGTTLTMSDLGQYSVAVSVTLLPAAAALKMLGPVLLPLLSRAQSNADLFGQRYRLVGEAMALLGIALAVPFVTGGTSIIRCVFGESYVGAGAVVGWLALAQATKLMRGSPTTAALAVGDSRNSMVSNLWRSSGVVAAVIAAFLTRSLTIIAICAFAGELAGYIAATVRLWIRHSISPLPILRPTLVAAMICGIAAILGCTGTIPGGRWSGVLAATIATIIALLLGSCACPELWKRIGETMIGARRHLATAHIAD